MTTYLGKSCSFCLPRVPFLNCRQFMYFVISLLVLRAGYGIWLYQFLIIAYLFTLPCLQHSAFIHLRITRTTIFSQMSSYSGKIRLFTPELFALNSEKPPLTYNGADVISSLASLVFIGSKSNIQWSRTGIYSRTSSKSGQIRQFILD